MTGGVVVYSGRTAVRELGTGIEIREKLKKQT